MSGNPEIETLHVELGDRSYDIVVGDGLISDAGNWLLPVLRSNRVVIVTDEHVAPHWLSKLTAALDKSNIHHRSITLPPGESTKNMDQLATLVDDLLDHGIDRKTTLIALGGGVIGDLTGFAAAIALRGIDFIQVPTTLLAQVDSSVGGKTGIDTRQGKNLVGAFHQPRLVLIDTATLDTLPMRDRRSGYAEVLKYGVIGDRPFFDWLLKNGADLIDGDAALRRTAIIKSCQAKADIVAQDEREGGVRALLNLGHTFGHALETQVGFDDGLTHGEAVGIGMVMACALSEELGMARSSERAQLVAHLKSVGLPYDLSGLDVSGWTADQLLRHMDKDKKTEGGKLTFILPNTIGKTDIFKDVAKAPVRSVLQSFIDPPQ